MAQKYQLRVNASINALDEHGYYNSCNGSFQVQEDVQFEATSFLEIAALLGKFHEFSEDIKARGKHE